MTDFKEKPPTQVAGVAGFVAFTTPADEPKPMQATNSWQRIDWQKLQKLPPFEMFVTEVYGGRETILDKLIDQDNKLYLEYCDWHKAKGYWANETPMGEVIDGRA